MTTLNADTPSIRELLDMLQPIAQVPQDALLRRIQSDALVRTLHAAAFGLAAWARNCWQPPPAPPPPPKQPATAKLDARWPPRQQGKHYADMRPRSSTVRVQPFQPAATRTAASAAAGPRPAPGPGPEHVDVEACTALLGLKPANTSRVFTLITQGRFPPPALKHKRRAYWLRTAATAAAQTYLSEKALSSARSTARHESAGATPPGADHMAIAQVAKRRGVSPVRIYQLMLHAGFPRPACKHKGRVYWLRADVDAACTEHDEQQYAKQRAAKAGHLQEVLVSARGTLRAPGRRTDTDSDHTPS